MNLETFKKLFIEAVEEALNEAGLHYALTYDTFKKFSRSYEALIARKDDIGVNLDIDEFYKNYLKGKPVSELVDNAIEIIDKAMDNSPNGNDARETLENYSNARQRLFVTLVSADVNPELLSTVPHRIMDDMAIVYRCSVSVGDAEDGGTVLINDSLLSAWGISADQLHEDAMQNSIKTRPAVIQGMSVVLAKLMNMSVEELYGDDIPEEEAMFVASTPDTVLGAGVITYPNFFEKAAEQLGGGFYVLPSSIHEVILVPDKFAETNTDFRSMVTEINATQVEPRDRLIDNYYHYDSEAHIFETGEAFKLRKED